MASAGERVQKLSAEAFTRLKNDHEQFLEAYEKPTQIYRFLQARHSFKSLFMHRNLSYMQRRRDKLRKRRSSRLRIADLLKHRKHHHEPERRDFASQIKSDNFLKIKFHDLEKGIDFDHLLSTALGGDTKAEPPAGCAPSLMEVEVLLYNCHQHIMSETASCPCSSVSLGKFEIEYAPSNSGKVAGRGSTSLTLTVPESQLVWQGHKKRAPGPLMLVFHARASSGHSHKKSVSGLVSHHLPPQLSKVSVEVNRINHSDIAQLTRARQAAGNQQQETTSDFKEPKISQTERVCDSKSWSLSDTGQGLPENSSHSKASRKTRSAKSKVRRDACIMTDLSLGTGDTSGLSRTATNQTTTTKEGTESQSPPKLFQRKGFTETTSSILRKLTRAPPLNGLNGLTFHNGLSEDHQSMEEHSDHSCNGQASLVDKKALPNYSLTVSIPCAMAYNNTASPTSTAEPGEDYSGKCDMAHRDSSPLPPAKRKCKIPTRKRSEVQLLLDRDKPPEERISAEDVPVFIAEDLADRTTPQTHGQQSGVSWTQLGTGTRKILPVDLLTYPVGTAGCVKKAHEGGGVKRALSDPEVLPEADALSPPLKMARVSGTDSAVKEVGSSVEDSTGVEDKNSDFEKDDMETEPLSTPHTSLPCSARDEAAAGTGSSTASSARDDSSGTGTAPEGLFCAEMVVFDSRGECLLDEGEYSILMQKCPQRDVGGGPPPLTTFSPLSWSSVFGGGDQEKVEQSESMMLKFSLSWSRGPPKHRLISELQTALDLQRIRNDYFPPKSDSDHLPPATTIASDPPLTSPTSAAEPLATDPPKLLPPNSERDTSMSASITGCEERESERASRLNGSRLTVLPETEKSESKEETEEEEIQDVDKNSKDDLEEYFTATEASASSSDSTEISQPLTTSTTAATAASVIAAPQAGRGGDEGGRVVYNFLYHSNGLQQTEPRRNMQCPWCYLSCCHLYSLLKHMSLCHPRFLFTYTPVEGGSIIDVHVNKLYETGQTSMERDPVERSGMNLRQRWKGPLKCLPCTAILVERHEECDDDMSEFLNDGSWKRGYNVKRQFYHSTTCLPMVPDEIDADSEAEQDFIDRWQRTCSQKMIDDFTDVNRGEKEMMKMWNLFAMEQGMIADKQIPAACAKFVRDKALEIVQDGHNNSLLAHLANMCQFGLIPPSVIRCCSDTLNDQQQPLPSSLSPTASSEQHTSISLPDVP